MDSVLDLCCLNQKCDRSLWFLPHHRAAPSFQMTAEKRPSSDMMKPKPKPQKKKKKKDPNEPTKPVSAYALFFRDTQAAIKGQNPNATFGDVSKIVASMWDGLGEEQKQVWVYERQKKINFHCHTDLKCAHECSVFAPVFMTCWSFSFNRLYLSFSPQSEKCWH